MILSTVGAEIPVSREILAREIGSLHSTKSSVYIFRVVVFLKNILKLYLLGHLNPPHSILLTNLVKFKASLRRM